MAWMLQEIHDDGAPILTPVFGDKAAAMEAGAAHGATLRFAHRVDVVWIGIGPSRRSTAWVRPNERGM